MFSRISGLFLLSLLTIGLIASCSDDNNIVGSGIISSDREIITDTVSISDLELVELLSFTGNLTYFSAGRYNDPVFGETSSSAFIAPGINALRTADSLWAGAEVYLVLHPFDTWGDTLSTATYNVHFITERWRVTSSNASTEVVKDPVSFATVEITADTDSVIVPLPQSWADNYRELFHTTEDRQNNLRQNEFGFALVPSDESSKIVSFRQESVIEDSAGNRQFTGSRLLVVNPPGSLDPGDDENGNGNGNGASARPAGTLANGEIDLTDRNFFGVPFRGAAFNIQSQPGSGPQEGTIPVLNTFQQTLRLGLNLADLNLEGQVINRAELVLFDETDTVAELPENHFRPDSGRLLFYTLSQTERQFEVIKQPRFEPPVRSSDRSYRVNVTDFVKSFQLGQTIDDDFFIISGNNSGRFQPKILSGPGSGDRSPKLIITRINPER